MFRGEYDESVRLRRRSAELGDEAGLVSKPILDYQTVAFVAIAVLRDVDRARDALREVRRRIADSIGTERAYVDFYEATLARETGDAQRAIRYARNAERLGQRLDDSVADDAVQMRADVLSALGLHRRATGLYRSIAGRETSHSDPCASARFLGNRAWATVLARVGGVDLGFDVSSDAGRAISLYESQCPDPANVLNLRVTLALDALQTHSLGLARAHLDAASRSTSGRSTEVKAWLHIAEADLAIEEGRIGEARRSCEALAALGVRVRSTPLRWRSTLCAARCEEAVRNGEDAVRFYERAERYLDETAAMPFAGPGLRFDVDVQDLAARRHAELLMRSGDARAAVEVLDRHALRARRGLERGFRVASIRGDARRVWERAAMRYTSLRTRLDTLDATEWSEASTQDTARSKERAEIENAIQEALAEALNVLGPRSTTHPLPRSARPGDLVLTIDRLTEDWLVFAETAKVTRSVRLPSVGIDGPEEELSQRLLIPFADLLETTKSVRVVARGRAHRIDVHRLPWRGRPLVESHVITYAADGREASWAMREATMALVVDDPSGNLPSARDEVRRVLGDLERVGWRSDTIAGRGVTRSRLLSALERSSLLHWAGHGRDDPEVGFGAALPLAGRAVLDVGDILALPNVPEMVVLSGCATAPPDTREVGPARAFVLAGAHEVIATSRPVRDADAHRITGALYSKPFGSLASALRRAQSAVAESHAQSDWAAFRVYVP